MGRGRVRSGMSMWTRTRGLTRAMGWGRASQRERKRRKRTSPPLVFLQTHHHHRDYRRRIYLLRPLIHFTHLHNPPPLGRRLSSRHCRLLLLVHQIYVLLLLLRLPLLHVRHHHPHMLRVWHHRLIPHLLRFWHASLRQTPCRARPRPRQRTRRRTPRPPRDSRSSRSARRTSRFRLRIMGAGLRGMGRCLRVEMREL
ncbi:hypothetical protein B0H12DRAFT_1152266 [Mycena haematopus]|nr:hypothetical protein B0H12DRAFT_1152266 [Mycena haematopus]